MMQYVAFMVTIVFEGAEISALYIDPFSPFSTDYQTGWVYYEQMGTF